ncbi:MAG TPA: GH116 family glycosyl-hydrolase [Candidatus Latescibacteria bacterium]|nr:GH116 family glycosyl-hydrolase [Candidatus Latescibacterota bacterium]
MTSSVEGVSMPLFPTDLPEREWCQFNAEGFSRPVCGLIHWGTNAPVCGMPLGGIDTGCLDLEATGVWGYCSIFNSLNPRRGAINEPFLGVSVGRQTWVLSTVALSRRDGQEWIDTMRSWASYRAVKSASDIHYWGHFPVADLEYETDAPLSIGMRAWAPFIPGDVALTNAPAAVFEVHLRNSTETEQKGTLAFSFPGPNEGEAGTTTFRRVKIEGAATGVSVESPQASYVLTAIGESSVRTGGCLGTDAVAWSCIEDALPFVEAGAGTSIAVDFALSPGAEKTIRFVLAWFAPVWNGGGIMTGKGQDYRHMYARRYANARAVAEMITGRHEEILRRIIAWQSVLYGDEGYPVWLRDALVNVLHLIPETSIWAQAKPPVGDWCNEEDGVFGMNESPRACPQIECIPCSFYGNFPLVYFFPEAALSTLRAYKAYQYPSGQAPWVFGGCTVGSPPYEMAMPSPGYAKKPQTTLDGGCYVDMVDRMWRRTGDDQLLREFYDSVKRNTIFTMNLRPGSGAAGIVSMPEGNQAQDWFESCDLFGIVPHIGGVHLAQIRMARRMAKAVGDEEFVRQCDSWLAQGSEVLENETWAGTHYLLFKEKETGKESDIIMSYVFDGEWMAKLHGLEGVFRPDRVKTMLETIRRTAIAMSPFGSVVFCKPEGALGKEDWDPGYWGAHGVHPPGTFMLAMTYLFYGEKDTGLDLARRTMGEIVKRGWYWDVPVAIDGTAPRIGFDYYQNLVLWSFPAVMEGADIAAPCKEGGLVDRVIKAGSEA